MCVSTSIYPSRRGWGMCCYVSLAKRIQFALPVVAPELATSATSSSHLQTTWNFRKTLLTHPGSKPAWCERSTCTAAKAYEGAEQLKHLAGQSPWTRTSSGNGVSASFIAPPLGKVSAKRNGSLTNNRTCAPLKPRLSGHPRLGDHFTSAQGGLLQIGAFRITQ